MSLIKNTTLALSVVFLISLTGCESEEDVQKKRNSGEAEIELANMHIKAYSNALDMYKLDNGILPSTEQGLSALVSKPTTEPLPENYRVGGYISGLVKDAWNNDFVYVCPGIHNPNGFDLYSLGPDGKSGTEDDIKNWK